MSVRAVWDRLGPFRSVLVRLGSFGTVGERQSNWRGLVSGLLRKDRGPETRRHPAVRHRPAANRFAAYCAPNGKVGVQQPVVLAAVKTWKSRWFPNATESGGDPYGPPPPFQGDSAI